MVTEILQDNSWILLSVKRQSQQKTCLPEWKMLNSSCLNLCIQQWEYEVLCSCSCIRQTQSWALSVMMYLQCLQYVLQLILVLLTWEFNYSHKAFLYSVDFSVEKLTGKRDQGTAVCRVWCAKNAVVVSVYRLPNCVASQLTKELQVRVRFAQNSECLHLDHWKTATF